MLYLRFFLTRPLFSNIRVSNHKFCYLSFSIPGPRCNSLLLEEFGQGQRGVWSVEEFIADLTVKFHSFSRIRGRCVAALTGEEEECALSRRLLVGGEELEVGLLGVAVGRATRRLSASDGAAPPLRDGIRACVAR